MRKIIDKSKMPLFLIASVTLVFLAAPCPAAGPSEQPAKQETRSFYMGFTPFPWDMTVEAIETTSKFIVNNGDIIAHHLDAGVPWPEALEDKPFHPKMENNWKNRREIQKSKKVLVSVTPLNGGRNAMALYWGEKENMPLPEKFKNLEFDDPIVKKAYLNYCRRAVEHFGPDYLAIGIEVNELFHHSPEKWPGFVKLYKNTYSQLKKKYPDLAIFATVTLHNLTNKGWKDMKLQQDKIRDFLQHVDIAGISYYPFMAGQSEKPTEIFDWIRSFTDKPIAITETGYPAETIKLKTFNLTITSNPSRQATYFQTLLDRAGRDNYLFVIAFLHRDYDAMWEKIKSFAPEAFIVWKDCGLLDEAGRKRESYDVWKKYLSMKRLDNTESKQ